MTYPQEALDAAAAEVAWRTHGSRAANPDDIMFASRILGAAAPLIAAAERERIAVFLDEIAHHHKRDIAAGFKGPQRAAMEWACHGAAKRIRADLLEASP